MQLNFEISQALAQRILDYLVSKPYAEVHALVAELRSIKPMETPDGSSTK